MARTVVPASFRWRPQCPVTPAPFARLAPSAGVRTQRSGTGKNSRGIFGLIDAVSLNGGLPKYVFRSKHSLFTAWMEDAWLMMHSCRNYPVCSNISFLLNTDLCIFGERLQSYKQNCFMPVFRTHCLQ